MSKAKRPVYYKIVYLNQNGEFVSYIHVNHPILTVKYKVNQWVKPNMDGTKLMCFRTLDDAKRLHRVHHLPTNSIIFRCHVKRPSKVGIFISRFNVMDFVVYSQILYRLQLKRQHRKYCFNGGLPPDGTVFCDEIMLLDRVEY